MSSHVLAELEEMADDAVYVQRGETVSADRLEALRDAPRLWRIRAANPAALDAALAGRPDLSEDHLGRLVPVRDESEAADLLAHLVTAGVRIVAFGPASGEMERTFLELSREARA